jgi:hypothetical protein
MPTMPGQVIEIAAGTFFANEKKKKSSVKNNSKGFTHVIRRKRRDKRNILG